MSVEITHNNKTLEFKGFVTLESFSEAMDKFNTAFTLLVGRTPTYQDFTSWIATLPNIEVKEFNSGKEH